ncbi:MAG: hypothetical protein E7547_01805 [Ruminococcaceae bacterium]|nr:hypothetical protein [Oscillospiraceae bacterium]
MTIIIDFLLKMMYNSKCDTMITGGQTMKKIAKILSVALAVMIVFIGNAIPASAAGESYLTIKDYGGFAMVTDCNTTASGTIDIPSTYEGVSVTHIGNNAFKDCTRITQVNIPSSVTSVGSNAFDSCEVLTKVVFEGSTCDIKAAAFNNCGMLESVTLPSSLKSVADKTFYGCRTLASISIPSTVTSIGKEAFGLCSSLASVTIPASVTSIGKNAFIGCNSVSSYGVASGNSVYSSVSGVLYGPYEAGVNTAKTLIQYPNAKTQTSYTVASGTKIIADYAFGDNTNLTNVTLPSGLEKIDSYAFYNCKKLSSVTLPSTVTYLGSQSFGRCPALKSITIPASVETFESAFYKSGLETVVILNGVKTIGTKAFENCTSLTSVEIPASVKTIDIGAFYGCTSLGNLNVPATVTTLNTGAFQGCDNITLWVESGSAAHTYAVNNSVNYEIGTYKIDKTVKSISVLNLPSITSYYYKDTLDTTGLVLSVNYTDGTSETVKSGYEVTPKKLSKTGSQVITVTYEDCTATFSVNVSYAWWQWIIRILLLGFLWY